MVNALFDGNVRSTGSSGGDRNGDITSISAETFEFINASDHGVVLSVNRTDVCDINVDITIHTPLNTQIPLLTMDSNNSTVLQVNQNSTTQSTDTSITRSVFTLVSGINLYTGTQKTLMSTVPMGYTPDTTRYFRSHLNVGVHYNYFIPLAYKCNVCSNQFYYSTSWFES